MNLLPATSNEVLALLAEKLAELVHYHEEVGEWRKEGSGVSQSTRPSLLATRLDSAAP